MNQVLPPSQIVVTHFVLPKVKVIVLSWLDLLIRMTRCRETSIRSQQDTRLKLLVVTMTTPMHAHMTSALISWQCTPPSIAARVEDNFKLEASHASKAKEYFHCAKYRHFG